MNKKLPKTATLEMQAHIDRFDEKVTLFGCDMSEYGHILLGPVTVTFDVPQIDIVAAQLNSLEKAKAEVVKEYEIKLHDLDEKIQNLRALSYMPGETA